MRIAIALLLVLLLAVAGVWLFGPREPADTAVSFDPATIGPDADVYLARREADVPNLRANAAKKIVWAYPASRARTPIALVYVHGFSATREETRPLADEVAAALGANLFYTRLTGHGRDGPAMAEASVKDWLDDLAEAVAVGRAIGNRVIVIATSTGATLATLGATVPGVLDGVDGLVMISPNFGLRDRWAFLLDLPFARRLLPLFGKEEYGFEPLSAEQAANWTTSYPTAALLPLAALIRATRKADVSAIRLPVLALYSPTDTIVDTEATGGVLARWGAPRQAVEVPVSGDPANHLIAGRIVSPRTTEELAARIARWIGELPPR